MKKIAFVIAMFARPPTNPKFIKFRRINPMRNIGYAITAGIGLVAFGFAGSAFAQSAKFAATWDNDPITAEATSNCDSVGICGGKVTDDAFEFEMAEIHLATHKSALIGVSAQIGVHLITNAKGKGGSTVENVTSTAKAKGDVTVTVTLENQGSGEDCLVAPGPIVFKSEMRELSVSADSSAETIDVVVGIDTESISANHFNFLGVECDQGVYKMMARFDLSALADATGVDSLADALVTLGSRMITLQEVRAVKGSLIED